MKSHGPCRLVGVLAPTAVACLLVGRPAQAQNAAPAAPPNAIPKPSTSPPPGEMRPLSTFGRDLTLPQTTALLREMRQMTEQALATSRGAEKATSVDQVKAAAEKVLQAVWGMPSGLARGATGGGIAMPGWKERWQVSGAELPDTAWMKRNGTLPPKITDPRQLGIMGRGLAVRGKLETISRGSSLAFVSQDSEADASLASLNNVIGWTYESYGRKGEWQPRPSLTDVWDAPAEFWNSSADTGWLAEAYAQAINILKTDYAGDVAMARQHAAGMSSILKRVLDGMDADKNGTVEAKPMEGGLITAVNAASRISASTRSN